MGGMRQAVGDPDLHEGLTAYAKVWGFLVQCLDHPCGEVHIDAFGLHVGPFRFGHVGKGHHTAAIIKVFIKIIRFHRQLSNGLNPLSLKAVGFVFP